MFFVVLLSRLPLFVLYRFSDFLFFLGYHVTRYRRGLVRRNLEAAFPEKSVAERRAIEKSFYHRLCDYVVETLKLLTISPAALQARMRFTNPEVVTRFFDQGQSVLYLTSHQFNWEWLLCAGGISLPFPVRFVYQRVNNAFVDRLLTQCRTRFGAMAVERGAVAREAVRKKDERMGIAMLGDQYPGHGSDKKYAARFLNQETVFFQAINQLALLTRFPALFFDVCRIRRGYYEATVKIIGVPPYAPGGDEVIRSYIEAAERGIRSHPAGWLWSHNRWKKRHLTPA